MNQLAPTALFALLVAAAPIVPARGAPEAAAEGTGGGLVLQSGESPADFAARNGPAGATVEKVTAGVSAWGGTTSFVAFYRLGTQDEEGPSADLERLEALVFIPQGRGVYLKGRIGGCRWEGGPPSLEAVFFAKGGNPRRAELFLICSWPVQHPDVQGKLYATYAFDPPRVGGGAVVVEGGERKSLSGGCDCDRADGTSHRAKYKTEQDVRAALQARR